jgi:hypothetical protein
MKCKFYRVWTTQTSLGETFKLVMCFVEIDNLILATLLFAVCVAKVSVMIFHGRVLFRKTGSLQALVSSNQFCLRMGTEPVPETLYLNELTRLFAREDYIESCRR